MHHWMKPIVRIRKSRNGGNGLIAGGSQTLGSLEQELAF